MEKMNNDVNRLKASIVEMISNLKGKDNESKSKPLLNWINSGEFLVDLNKYSETREFENKLDSVANTIKELVPWNAILPTEKIKKPEVGPNSDCLEKHTYHVDEFLYDDSEAEEILQDKGIKQKYCQDCGSFNMKDTILISHSLSRTKLQYIFKVLLPKDCSSKKILDVGSRIGAVLYGAYFCTNSSEIYGVEMNRELCDLQNKIITHYNMEERIKLINDDIAQQEDIVAISDIVILNNVFEFFLEQEAQIKIWRFIKKTLKKGCLIVSIPSIEENLDNLNIYDEFSKWIEKCAPFQEENNAYFDEETMLSFHDIYFYTVK